MPEPTLQSLNLFAEPQHQPFRKEGGQPAALLLHGFMGTPAEMRPLAGNLHQAGWTVEGMLLPGFGRQVDTLFDRHYQEWIAAAAVALAELQKKHEPVLLIGYSMGAAVALPVAAESRPDGLILIAPFWRLGNRFHHLIWGLLKRLFPNPRPFRRANFTNPRLAEFIGGLVPDIDLADPQVQAVLRDLRVPSRFVDQIFSLGQAAQQAAVAIQSPTLIVQGVHDPAVKPAYSRQLAENFSTPVVYKELEADHGLVEAGNPGFPRLSSSVLDFARDMTPGYQLTVKKR